MEIITPTSKMASCSTTTNLNFSFTRSSSLSTKPHNHRFQTPLRTSHLSVSPRIPRTPSRQPLAASHSVADDGVSGLATKIVEADPSLAVKNKAMEISPELKGTSIFLVGMTSTVKTSLGKLLADALRYYYFDSDSLVEEAAGGESTSQIFKERDEKGFRESETEVLRQLSSMGRLVVCAGDGAVQNSTNLGLLRHGISIWIDVPLYMVAKGLIEDGGVRPASETPPIQETSYEINDDQVLSQVIEHYEKMRDRYAIADATVSLQRLASQLGFDDLDAITTEDMTMEVLKEIEKLTRVKKMMEEAARPF